MYLTLCIMYNIKIIKNNNNNFNNNKCVKKAGFN